MEAIVEENGQVDPLSSSSPDPGQAAIASSVQSVIQPNQQSVIQTAANIQPMLSKGNVILVSKPNSVIQTTQGSLQTLRVVETTGSDDSFSEEESPKKRRDLLTRRPSYRKILNDLGGGEIAVLPAAIQITSGEAGPGLHTLTMTNATAGGAIVQYAQGQEFFVPGKDLNVLVKNENGELIECSDYVFPHPDSPESPSLQGTYINKKGGWVVAQGGNISGGTGEDQARKRELRLLKNREAARECRRKKKEYIKCLENRVAVLENQNKALIEELKSLKELYCQQKSE